MREKRNILEYIAQSRPLIHSITSPVAINDCANAVLAVGAQPIMAEHPKEVAGITSIAKALTVSLANITDARLESILIAGKTAWEKKIPSMIDLVGITCSEIRMEEAKQFLAQCHPAVVKGNYTEIRAIVGASYDSSSGIDVGSGDAANEMEMETLISKFAAEHHTVVMATGAVDLISDGNEVLRITRGDPMMARMTGTGCILTCITGVYLSACEPMDACRYALLHWDISGERAADYVKKQGRGLGMFHMAILDELSMMTAEDLEEADL